MTTSEDASTRPPPDQHPFRIGLRIARLRKIHGLTRRLLAARANVSYSLLSKIERGDQPASPSFTAAIARALEVNVVDLTEQPYGARNAPRPQSRQPCRRCDRPSSKATTPNWTPRCVV
jgi:transcriptional regulator with XRE-family HTH domain